MPRALGLLMLVGAMQCAGAQTLQRAIALPALRSGIEFSGADVRSMQADDFANPGFLWVQRGERLWRQTAGGASCAACHGEAATSMHGVAARYPLYDATSARVLDLEARINDCRVRRQGLAALERESDDLLGLTAYLAQQSRGVPLSVSVEGGAAAAFERGRDFYNARHGQMNLSCAQCHD